jgi:hypothetical protein
MQFRNLAAIVPLLVGVFATPVAGDASLKIVKRAEGVHLINCGTTYSVVDVSSPSSTT